MADSASGTETPCPHKEIHRVNDFSTGDEICARCGRVMDKALVLDEMPGPDPKEGVSLTPKGSPFSPQYSPVFEADLSPPSSQPHDTPDYQKKQKKVFQDSSLQWEMEKSKREEIYHFCSMMHVDNESVVESAYRILLRIEKSFIEEGKRFKCPPRPEHIAVAIWEALNQQNTPRSPKVVAQACGVDPRMMLRIEKQLTRNMWFMSRFGDTFTFKPPKLYVETACDILYLPFTVTKMVKALVEQCEDDYSMCDPDVVLSSAILLICKAVRQLDTKSPSIKKLQEQILHIDLEFIQRDFDVKKNSVKDMSKRLDKFSISAKDSLEITFKNKTRVFCV